MADENVNPLDERIKVLVMSFHNLVIETKAQMATLTNPKDVQSFKACGENVRKIWTLGTECGKIGRELQESFDSVVKTGTELGLLKGVKLIRDPRKRAEGAGRKPMTAAQKFEAAVKRSVEPKETAAADRASK